MAERAGVWDANKDGIHVDFTQAFAMDRGHLSPVRDTFAGILFAVFQDAFGSIMDLPL